MAIFPFNSIFSIFLSSDRIRWTAHAFLALFTIIIYIIFNEKDTALSLLKQKKKIPPLLIAVYLIAYMLIIFDPYCIITAH